MPKKNLFEGACADPKTGNRIAGHMRGTSPRRRAARAMTPNCCSARSPDQPPRSAAGRDRPLRRQQAALLQSHDVREPARSTGRSACHGERRATPAAAACRAGPDVGSTLARPQPTRAVVRLEERAFLHFNRLGQRMAIRTGSQHDLFHATRPIPLKVNGAANPTRSTTSCRCGLPYSRSTTSAISTAS